MLGDTYTFGINDNNITKWFCGIMVCVALGALVWFIVAKPETVYSRQYKILLKIEKAINNLNDCKRGGVE